MRLLNIIKILEQVRYPTGINFTQDRKITSQWFFQKELIFLSELTPQNFCRIEISKKSEPPFLPFRAMDII